MRTVTFQSVLHGAARMLGMDPARDLTFPQAATLTEYIQTRFDEAVGFEFWPELMATEERTVDGNKVFAYEEVGKTDIGEVANVALRNPRQSRAPGYMPFEPCANGIQLAPEAPATVWVTFRVRPATWTSVPWTAATAASLVLGAVRYYPVTGECYVSLEAGNVAVPGSDATKWVKVDFPMVLAPFVKRAAAADRLGDQKQQARKATELAQAYQDLSDAAEQATSQQGQFSRIEVRGY